MKIDSSKIQEQVGSYVRANAPLREARAKGDQLAKDTFTREKMEPARCNTWQAMCTFGGVTRFHCIDF